MCGCLGELELLIVVLIFVKFWCFLDVFYMYVRLVFVSRSSIVSSVDVVLYVVEVCE